MKENDGILSEAKNKINKTIIQYNKIIIIIINYYYYYYYYLWVYLVLLSFVMALYDDIYIQHVRQLQFGTYIKHLLLLALCSIIPNKVPHREAASSIICRCLCFLAEFWQL